MKRLKISFMISILMVTLVGAINLGVVNVGKETKAYSMEDAVFASGMDLYFQTIGIGNRLLDLSPYRNYGVVYGSPSLDWGRYGKAIDFNPDGGDYEIDCDINDGEISKDDGIYINAWSASSGDIDDDDYISVGQRYVGGAYYSILRG